MTGTIYRTGIMRGRRHNSSEVEHLVEIDHRYGASKERAWVRPLCGTDSGQAALAWDGRLCKRCEARAKAAGYDIVNIGAP